jgi:hypothetical protein
MCTLCFLPIPPTWSLGFRTQDKVLSDTVFLWAIQWPLQLFYSQWHKLKSPTFSIISRVAQLSLPVLRYTHIKWKYSRRISTSVHGEIVSQYTYRFLCDWVWIAEFRVKELLVGWRSIPTTHESTKNQCRRALWMALL